MRDYPRVDHLAWLLSAHATPPRSVKRLHTETTVPASLDRTFGFFSDAANLQRLTPGWLNFTVLTPMPVAMREGLVIDYRISLYGLPLPWRSRIDVWEPGIRFVDRQLVGPYLWWRHEHRFEATGTGTRVIDHVDYAPRAAWVSGALVRRNLAQIFAYRQRALRDIFRAGTPAD